MSNITLGQLINGDASKDAVHVAIAPAVAGSRLSPGDPVTLHPDGSAHATAALGVGIVDPFLRSRVMPGERFWVFMHPGTVSNLRHEWSHPAFPAPATAPLTTPEYEALTARIKELEKEKEREYERGRKDMDEELDDGCRGC